MFGDKEMKYESRFRESFPIGCETVSEYPQAGEALIDSDFFFLNHLRIVTETLGASIFRNLVKFINSLLISSFSFSSAYHKRKAVRMSLKHFLGFSKNHKKSAVQRTIYLSLNIFRL